VKLDKGFDEGTYACIVSSTTSRPGRLRPGPPPDRICPCCGAQLGHSGGYALGEPRTPRAPPARAGAATWRALPVLSPSRPTTRFHDDDVERAVRLAFLRAGQCWDQAQAASRRTAATAARSSSAGSWPACWRATPYAAVGAEAKERLLA